MLGLNFQNTTRLMQNTYLWQTFIQFENQKRKYNKWFIGVYRLGNFDSKFKVGMANLQFHCEWKSKAKKRKSVQESKSETEREREREIERKSKGKEKEREEK